MLLALWFDFWNLADWIPAPPPVVVVKPTEGGHRPDKGYEPRADYEWWDEYERLLKRLHPIEVREDAPVEVKRKAAQANRLIQKVKTHTPPSKEAVEKVGREIQKLSSEVKKFQINETTSQIDELALKSRDEEEAILALLL